MKNSILGLLLLFAAIGIFWSWTLPMIDEVKALKADKKAFDVVLEASKELLGARDKLIGQFNSISASDLERFYKIVPVKPESDKLMVELADVAAAAGGIVKQFQNNEADGVIDAQIGFYGTYEGFRGFLDSLQKSLRLIDVDQIDFSSDGEKAYDFSIKVKSYYKNEE